MAKKNYKQFLLVIDWCHPLPEGNRGGFGYEFFDTLEELKARAEEIMESKHEARETGNWNVPGIAQVIVAQKLVGYAMEKDKFWTAVAYEQIAALWCTWKLGENKEFGWKVKDWCSEEEWEHFKGGCDRNEVVYGISGESIMTINHGWDYYEAAKASKQKKAVC